jgi:hypothetical protein
VGRARSDVSTPEIYLRTGFVLDARGRIVCTNEPGATKGPLFTIVRSDDASVWAVHADVPDAIADEVEQLAASEAPSGALRHAARYLELLRAHEVADGPAFAFPRRSTIPATS